MDALYMANLKNIVFYYKRLQQILFSVITQKYSEQIRWNFIRTFIRTYEYNNTKTRYILVYKCLKMQCKHEKCDGIWRTNLPTEKQWSQTCPVRIMGSNGDLVNTWNCQIRVPSINMSQLFISSFCFGCKSPGHMKDTDMIMKMWALDRHLGNY